LPPKVKQSAASTVRIMTSFGTLSSNSLANWRVSSSPT
jgi:hypothetical protein